jgi:hypothetical protein
MTAHSHVMNKAFWKFEWNTRYMSSYEWVNVFAPLSNIVGKFHHFTSVINLISGELLNEVQYSLCSNLYFGIFDFNLCSVLDWWKWYLEFEWLSCVAYALSIIFVIRIENGPFCQFDKLSNYLHSNPFS